MIKLTKVIIFLIVSTSAFAQSGYTLADSLRGSLRPERTCFDVTHYELDIHVDIRKKSISGSNGISFNVVQPTDEIQVDLFQNMHIDSISMAGQLCDYSRVHDAVFIRTPQLKAGQSGKITVYYHGQPKTARTPPWDGGFVWSEDGRGKPWIGVACEGIGASLWWPNKDHLSDEPDSMAIHVTIPDDLFCVANGNLRSIEPTGEDKSRYSWHVQYPINNYNVSINIADYARFSDTWVSVSGDSLDLSYFVLRENLAKARKHFRQVHDVLEAFYHYFGPYPFWNDGYCLVETPYLGMEHQSAIAYGNGYQRGYLGGMVPREFDFDYIIVHETGHEYWGNCISAPDLAEMWIHESFTTYMESLFVEYHFGKEAAERYLKSQKSFIMNREPVIGPNGVNHYGYMGSDHYYKGAWMLNTLRNAIGDDDKWFDLLRGLYQHFACSVVTSADLIGYFEERTDFPAAPFFQQYLNTTSVPVLKYQFFRKGSKTFVQVRFDNAVADFELPVYISDGRKEFRLQAGAGEQVVEIPFKEVRGLYMIPDKGYYEIRPVSGRGKIK